MKIIHLFSALALLISFTACRPMTAKEIEDYKNRQGNNGAIQSNSEITAANMRGKWATTCDEDSSNNQGMYRRDILEINANTITAINEVYSDKKCTAGLYTISKNGTPTITTATSTLSVSYVGGTVIPLTQAVADAFKTDSFCNVTSWTVTPDNRLRDLKIIPELSACKGVTVTSKDSVKLYLDGTDSSKDTLSLGAVKFMRSN